MLKLKKIAVTGDISSGKSTVCKIFQDLGAYIVNSDEIGKELLKVAKIKDRVLELLGEKVIENGVLSPKKIAEIVFDDFHKLQALEKILHPEILKEIKKQYSFAAAAKKYNLFVAEIPLLFEIKEEKNFDFIIYVTAQEKLLKERYKKNDFQKRENRYINKEEKTRKSNFLLENNSSIENLKDKVKEIQKKLI